MDIKTETLIILMEECGEVIQECSKILRFGNDSEKLHKELGDLLCMIRMTESNLGLNMNDTQQYSHDKWVKLQSWSKIVKPVSQFMFFQYKHRDYEYWDDVDVMDDNQKLWHYLVKDDVVYYELDDVLGPYRKPTRDDIDDVIHYIEMKQGMKNV